MKFSGTFAARVEFADNKLSSNCLSAPINSVLVEFRDAIKVSISADICKEVVNSHFN